MIEEGRDGDKGVVSNNNSRSWQNTAVHRRPSEKREKPGAGGSRAEGDKKSTCWHRAYRAVTWGQSQRPMRTYSCLDE